MLASAIYPSCSLLSQPTFRVKSAIFYNTRRRLLHFSWWQYFLSCHFVRKERERWWLKWTFEIFSLIQAFFSPSSHLNLFKFRHENARDERRWEESKQKKNLIEKSIEKKNNIFPRRSRMSWDLPRFMPFSARERQKNFIIWKAVRYSDQRLSICLIINLFRNWKKQKSRSGGKNGIKIGRFSSDSIMHERRSKQKIPPLTPLRDKFFNVRCFGYIGIEKEREKEEEASKVSIPHDFLCIILLVYFCVIIIIILMCDAVSLALVCCLCRLSNCIIMLSNPWRRGNCKVT